MTASDSSSAEAREYGYPRHVWVRVVLFGLALPVMLVCFLFLFAGAFLLDDSNYLALWPVWFRLLFYVFFGLLASVYVGLPLAMLVLSLREFWHRHDRVRVDERGVTIIQSGEEMRLAWDEVEVSRCFISLRFRAGKRECRLPLGLAHEREMREEIARRRFGEPEQIRRLREGDAVALLTPGERRALAMLSGFVGVLCLALSLPPRNVALPGTTDPLLPPMDPTGRVVAVLVSVGCLLVAGGLLTSFFRTTWQLLPDEFQYHTWYGRLHFLPYRSFRSLRWTPASRWNRLPKLQLRYRGDSGRERRLTFESRTEHPVLLTALREELVRRGEMVAAGEGIWEAGPAFGGHAGK